ncbi:hypothetical protein ACLMJK_008580 [Lecanora helva]
MALGPGPQYEYNNNNNNKMMMVDKSHRRPTSELEQRGHEYYRQGQYDEALLCFDQVRLLSHLVIIILLGLMHGSQMIDRTEQGRLAILDQRAAIHVKLNNLRAALSDAQRGYLRAGQVLQLMGKMQKAKDLYAMGLVKVSPRDPQLKLLQDTHKKLSKQIAASKFQDPLHVMPAEVAQMIMNFLDFQEICSCLRVSTTWYRFLKSMPAAWRHLDFGKAKKSVKLTAVQVYIEQAQGLVSRVVLPRKRTAAESIFLHVASKCQTTQEFVVPVGFSDQSLAKGASSASNLKNLIVGKCSFVAYETISRILDECRQLERAEFHSCDLASRNDRVYHFTAAKLQSLLMNNGRGYPEGSFNDFKSESLPNIRKLILHSWRWLGLRGPDFSELKKLETLDITDCQSNYPLRLPSSIIHLNVSKCVGPEPDIEENQFQHLTWLSVDDSRILGPLTLRRILLANPGKLKYLSAKSHHMCYHNFNNETMLTELIELGIFENVEELIFDACDFTDVEAVLLANAATALRALSLKQTKITGAGLRPLLTGPDGNRPCKLKSLSLDHCYQCSLDAVQFAQSLGVKTSFRFPDEYNGGKKVRSI